MKPSAIAALALAGLTAAGCVSAVQNRESMLSAAGFRVRVADTPEKVASLKKLPAHKFVMQSKNGTPYFVYADPSVCGCLYYGTEENYQSYKAMVFEQNLANEQQTAAMMMQQAAFDYGPWGPGPWVSGMWVAPM
ncbi:MAG: hypothetical protein CMN87_00040 [Stappia sp.]|uniref:hypothetical protein n=1 Tax=Stappia sp. TaxID=1870903 RepID=UPI000C3B1B1B|nr:hypothetical protein [Stappia sp.]MAA99625.1 hypothetical protein [Stappia sp.]MBM18374.1 hypothetical protein [Stappia sp.]